jgi:hypothetical protein
MTDSAFRIVVHQAERVIEVIYPARPTDEAFEAYDREIRAAIRAMGPPWKCLVDQRAVPVFDVGLGARIAQLNSWARSQGMERSVRVVPRGLMAQLQAKEIAEDSRSADAISVHHGRDAAWEDLTRDSSRTA